MEGPDWGELRPQRRCGWEEREARVSLLAPRFGSGRLGQWIERRFSPRPYRLHLDAFGAFVWLRLDGYRTVAQIAQEMRTEFGEDAEPVAERLTLFLRELRRGRFIQIPDDGGG